MERLRVAVIGAWGHVDAVLEEIDGLPWVEVVGYAKVLPEEEWGAEVLKFESGRTAKEWGDYRDLLKNGGAQVAVVSSRLDLIAPLAMEAAEAGCDLIIEKPLALTHRMLGELWRVLNERKTVCVSMLGNRCHPVLEAARKVVESGRLGKVVLVNARKSYKWGTRPAWFGDRSRYGGTIGWVGIHGLDFIHTATGEGFTSVAAMQGNLVHKERPGCEDHVALLLGLSGGGVATLSVDYLRPKTAETHGSDYLRIVGARGFLEADMTEGKLRVTTQDEPEKAEPIGERHGYYAEFFARIRDGVREPPADMRKAFELTLVGLCARDAADEGRVVKIAATW